MAAVQRKLVHKQFNSPMGLYSQQNVKETLNRELKAFGTDGIEIDEQIARPLNLANSAVLRAVEEEEQMKCGYKRVAWPPASEERIVREFTPQPQTQFPPAPGYNQQPAAQAAAAVPPTQEPNYYNNVQQHHAPINYNNTNNNNFARENNSPYKQTQNQTDYEAFPPQTPETPIILKDKQFSRLPSHEPNSVPYQYQQEQEHHQEQQYQPPQIPQQQQPQYQQPLYNQQNNPHHQHQHQQQYQPNPQNVAYPQQQYQPNPQNVAYPQQHQQQQPHYPHQEEHHQQQTLSGWKPIRPPQAKPETLFTGAYSVRETTPTVAPNPIYQQQYQNYHQQQQYRAPSYDNQQQQYQQPPQHQAQQQYPPQPQYQAQAPAQNQYQQQPHVGSQYQQPPQQQYQQPGQPAWAQQQQQYQQPPWVQQQPPQQQHQQPQYQNPSINQYNQAPYHQQQPQQQNQFVPQTNQQQFNSYSQPQQQQHTVSHDQVDQQQHYQPQLPQEQRGASPGIITLRKEAPITQKPAPVYASQPAATSYRGGSSMRGDLKWPPPEYKEAAAKENEERRKLALGPVCRPRKVNRDYTSFFAKNALSHHYPSYKVPPGTQHMIN
ncbi:putative mediator of RNA polymerase II transcription subunit 12 isoform X9 [Lucilia cuprina]|uniref:putative mediator of RNA polymerase II transcription subunit 12 isoform X9 n=1 Tax=Lucilia cuprina TaxID=7375 RepID=UPI001F058436|nr:putative mediator of RNA polymerase II transcription subunit 12 isoform X9 [Lucilia cuprina]